jgi:NAD(P)H dehydrogenase (quinone)
MDSGISKVPRSALRHLSKGGEAIMEVLVLYYSRSGNTQKMAEEIAKGVQQVEGVKCVMKSAQQVTNDDLVAAQGIIAGSPVYYGSMAAELKMVFDKSVGVRRQLENKVGAAFTTSGDPTGGKETTMLSIIQAMLISGMIVVGDPLDATGHYGTACCGKMSPTDRDNAAKLGKRVAALVKKIHG